MKKMIQFSSVLCVLFLLAIVTGCGPARYSSGGVTYSNGHRGYYDSSWGYDRYYRSGVNRHYNKPAVRARSHRLRRR